MMPRPRKREVVVFVLREPNQVLLGLGKRNKVQGKWGGYGGKVRDGETPEAAAVRELQEEATVCSRRLEKCGIVLKGQVPYPPQEILELHFFLVHEYVGQPIETEEMIPKWFRIDQMPFHRMWPGDQLIIPPMLRGEKIIASLLTNSDGTISASNYEVVRHLPRTIPFNTSP